MVFVTERNTLSYRNTIFSYVGDLNIISRVVQVKKVFKNCFRVKDIIYRHLFVCVALS